MSTRRVTTLRLALIVGVSLLLSLCFFAPRLWLMRHYVKGSFQWDRAETYLLQCEDPFRHDIEPAMLWRVLPPLAAHTLHLRGVAALALPWLGVLASTAYVAVLFRRRLDDWRFVAGGTLLYATTSAVLVPTGWLGMNDAWVWLGLLAVSFGQARWALPLACLLCPWIDERFILGFPLAWLVRQLDHDRLWNWRDAIAAAWLVPYAAIRLWVTQHHPSLGASGQRYLDSQFATTLLLLPLAPLAWWMGLRAAWGTIGYGVWKLPRVSGCALALAVVGTALVCLVLASDMSRSIAIVTPAVCLGCFALQRHETERAPSALLGFGVVNLLIPAAHMTYTKIDPISVLPVELLRLWRGA